MTPRTHDSASQPHTTAADYSEGPEAAKRFQAALGHLARVPKSAVPRPQPQARAKGRKKR